MAKTNLFLLLLVVIAPLRKIEIIALGPVDLVVGDIIIVWVTINTFFLYFYNSKYNLRNKFQIGKYCQNLILIILIGFPFTFLHTIDKPSRLIGMTLPLEIRYLATIFYGVLIYLNTVKIKKFKLKSVIWISIILATADISLSIPFATSENGKRIYNFLSDNGTAFFAPVAMVITFIYFLFGTKNKLLYLFLSIIFLIFIVIGGSRVPFFGLFFLAFYLIFRRKNKIDQKLLTKIIGTIIILSFLILLALGIAYIIAPNNVIQLIGRTINDVLGISQEINNRSQGSQGGFFLITIWVQMIQVTIQNPLSIIMGTGMNNLYAERILGYVDDELYNTLSRFSFINAHNAYVEVFTGQGIISLILYIRMLYLGLQYLKKFNIMIIDNKSKYILIGMGAYNFGHVAFESMFHPLASGHSNFYIFIFISSYLCGMIDAIKSQKSILISY